jgi:hypothetical protein
MEELTEKQKEILEIYYQNPNCTKKEIAEKASSCVSTVTRAFNVAGIKYKRINKESRKYSSGDLVGNNGLILLRRTFITNNKKWKGIFKCSCGTEFEAIISDVASGRCKSCGHEREHQIGEKLGDNQHTLLKRLYRSQGESHVWICLFKCGLCGKEFEADISRIVSNSRTSCGCNTFSKGEDRIRKILENNSIKFEKEKVFKDCINPETQNVLRFDFYLPDYNTCIEYDGKQHFQEVYFCPDSLEDRQRRDQVKNEYCDNNNIKLIRIPYTDYSKLNDSFLLEKLIIDESISL